MTMPSASRAATQKARVVTANFIAIYSANEQPEARLRRPGDGRLDQRVAGAFEAAVSTALAGSFNFWPTMIRSVVRLGFVERMALTVVPFALAMVMSVSPDLTV